MPSILIECGFLTNPKEEEYLHSEIGQDYIASAIFRAFRSYKESVEIIDKKSISKEDVVSSDDIKDETVEPNKKSDEVRVELLYKIQIGTFLRSMLNNQQFIDLKAEEVKVNGTYKYFVKSGNNKENSDRLKNKLRKLGFNGAFIVAFLDGKQISTKEALNLQNKLINNE
jgi:N-acetylmuramoyl-L-alanine amidase